MNPVNVLSLPLHRPVILKKNDTLKQAAQAMRHNEVGSVLVSDGKGVLRGLFTDRDLALALGLEKNRPSASLGKSTQTPLIYVSENATLPEVIAVMQRYGIRRVPVVKSTHGGRQRCLGIISLDDLVRDNLISLEDEKTILRNQLKTARPARTRGRVKNIFRVQDQRNQSLHLFLKNIERETAMNPADAKSLSVHMLGFICRRLPAKAGHNLVSQLPFELQVQLTSEISPAERSATAKSLNKQIQKRYHVDEETAGALMQGFWTGLESSISAGEIRILSRQLPKDLMDIFRGEPMLI